MHNDSLHIVFTGGGTGGHLFPGLAVASRFANAIPRARITFCGSGKPFEQRHVTQAGYDYIAIPSRPLPNAASEAVPFVVENLAGYLAAVRFLRKENVAAVVGLGGYASVPMARAAIRHDTPLILLEQNVIPGRATRWLARHASLICTSFPETAERLRYHCPLRLTGNPVRSDFRRCTLRPTGPRQLMVLGGSGGALALNQRVPLALYNVRDQLQGWRIVHQAGEIGLTDTRKLYKKLALEALVVPFVANMPQVLAATDLVVSRAGGTTLAELALVGNPAVLLPYPHAADDHQAANARAFAAGGGCVTIDDRNAEDRLDDHVTAALQPLLTDANLREQMSAAMWRAARPNAAADVAELIWSIVSSQACPAELAAV